MSSTSRRSSSKSKRSRRERSYSPDGDREYSSKHRRRSDRDGLRHRSSSHRQSSSSRSYKPSSSSKKRSRKRERVHSVSPSRSASSSRERSASVESEKQSDKSHDKREKKRKKIEESSDEEEKTHEKSEADKQAEAAAEEAAQKLVEEQKRILLERRKKIQEWKEKQKEKEIADMAVKEEEKIVEEQLKVKAKMLEKVKKENERRIRREKELERKKAEEYKRLKKERERKEREEEEAEKRRQKAEKLKNRRKSKVEVGEEGGGEDEGEVDPLDAFMIGLNTSRPVKKIVKKPKRPKIVFSKKLAAKLKKPARIKMKIGATERLFNEEVYSDDDLEMPEESSWLDKMKQKKKEIKPVDHSKMDYIDFRKDFYIESRDITDMTTEELAKYKKGPLGGVKIRGKNCPRPIKKWSQCGLPEAVYKTIRRYKYQEPFPVQCQAIPCVMSGRDCIACAKTGSGKTIAFVLPMIRHILDQPPLESDDGPIGLILSPTRELALQIATETKKFARSCQLRVVCCYGGAAVAEQIADLKRGCEIIVATPGRMIDMLSANAGRVTNLRRVTYLVLDEADRMFDMGFEPQIMTIINNTRPDRQTVMFSATFPRSVESLAKQALNKPVEIIIGGRSVASGDVAQTVKIVEENEKFRSLLKILGENYMKGQILIFVDRQEAVDRLFQDLNDAGYRSLCLHGAMDQLDRDCTIQDFKNKVRTILIATSIAARGLDVKDLNLVVNYTVPNHYEDYVHRVGRTGRAGTKGVAITLITPEQERYAPDLVKALTASKQKNIPQGLKDMAAKFQARVKSGEIKAHTTSVRSSGAKGFKFDEKESSKKDEQKRRESRVYGASADRYDAMVRKEEEEEESAKSAEQAIVKKMEEMKQVEEVMNPFGKQMAAAKMAAEAAMKSLKDTSHVCSDAQSTAMGRLAVRKALVKHGEETRATTKQGGAAAAKLIANAIAIRQKFQISGTAATPEAIREALADKLHQEEVEINDYPQHARWKATHKTSLSHIHENSDVAITTKGSYIPPGRKPGPGERKLYLLIEGRNVSEVRRAKADLYHLLEEAAANARPERDQYGKYQVI